MGFKVKIKSHSKGSWHDFIYLSHRALCECQVTNTLQSWPCLLTSRCPESQKEQLVLQSLAGGSCLEGVAEDCRNLPGWNPRLSDHAEGAYPLTGGGGHCSCLHLPLCHLTGLTVIIHLYFSAELHHPPQLDAVPAPTMLQVTFSSSSHCHFLQEFKLAP